MLEKNSLDGYSEECWGGGCKNKILFIRYITMCREKKSKVHTNEKVDAEEKKKL